MEATFHYELLVLGGKGGAGKGGAGDKKEEKPEIKFEPITADSLKEEKGFAKV